MGKALINRDVWPDHIAAHWDIDSSATKEIRKAEYPLEKAVSDYIRKMPFLWFEVMDNPGPDSLRGFIEKNAIALLSNCEVEHKPIDPPNEDWLGNWASSKTIRSSGLWNVNHITNNIHPDFIETFGKLIKKSTI